VAVSTARRFGRDEFAAQARRHQSRAEVDLIAPGAGLARQLRRRRRGGGIDIRAPRHFHLAEQRIRHARGLRQHYRAAHVVRQPIGEEHLHGVAGRRPVLLPEYFKDFGEAGPLGAHRGPTGRGFVTPHEFSETLRRTTLRVYRDRNQRQIVRAAEAALHVVEQAALKRAGGLAIDKDELHRRAPPAEQLWQADAAARVSGHFNIGNGSRVSGTVTVVFHHHQCGVGGGSAQQNKR